MSLNEIIDRLVNLKYTNHHRHQNGPVLGQAPLFRPRYDL